MISNVSSGSADRQAKRDWAAPRLTRFAAGGAENASPPVRPDDQINFS